jgi:hypothetical protein
MTHVFNCHVCKQMITHDDTLTTGHGLDRDGNKTCFVCCGKQDREAMVRDGRITLYLTDKGVTNWPGTLVFKPFTAPRKGYHNIARTRYDVWFVGPDKHIWHGVQYGEWTQICHCKRTRETWVENPRVPGSWGFASEYKGYRA